MNLHSIVQYHIANTLQWPALRPLQAEAVAPIMQGHDALLLAPTAGGKTEAAMFPLLSRALDETWEGLAIIYICPLKALLNNLHPRLVKYAEWTGHTVGIWHGDVTDSLKSRQRNEPPNIMLTTPESLESLLVSRKTDHRWFFKNVRAIVTDEIHAFAANDRGTHLRLLLERITRLSQTPVQRIGLSATVGNPEQVLTWYQGSFAGLRESHIICPPVSGSLASEITLEYVGGEDPTLNAARVIEALHHGEKRLVFCESRLEVEQLSVELRRLGVQTFLSHSSLSAEERFHAETAFAEARDCVIVSTSTLELGIDVGDLDRVIQIDAPRSVASFLQRIGRTGRRPGTSRNALFLAKKPESLLQTAGLLRLWGQGYVEPVVPPVMPLHIHAQQVLALCLQEGWLYRAAWANEWFGGEIDESVVEHLLAAGYLVADGAKLYIGPQTEKEFGKRNFMELLVSFTSASEFRVLHGARPIGRVDATMFMLKASGGNREAGQSQRTFMLAGRGWRVVDLDWKARICQVEPTDNAGATKWASAGFGSAFEMVQAQREVVLGEPLQGVSIMKRAQAALEEMRADLASVVNRGGTVIVEPSDGKPAEWFTWAGRYVEAVLDATAPETFTERQLLGRGGMKLAPGVTAAAVRNVCSEVRSGKLELRLPEPNEAAVSGLKFNALLPDSVAAEIVSRRSSDIDGARTLTCSNVIANVHFL